MSIRDSRPDTLALVLAGGNGTRLDPLTRHICKPALPFGGGFRSIDFSLSNCVNSGIYAIGVATQYKPAGLHSHLASAWNGASEASVAVPWHASERAPGVGYRGTADAVYRNLTSIHELDPQLVLVLAGDHVYKMDYRPMLAEHRANEADVTVGCVEVPTSDARHFGVLTVGAGDRIERFVEKPQSWAELPGVPGDTVLASMGIYVFSAGFLARILTADAQSPESRHDFGADILPKLIRSTRAFAHTFRGCGSEAPYWRDIGTLAAYWRAHMDLLGPTPMFALDDTAWPIRGASRTPRTVVAPLATARGGTIEDSIVGTRCVVAGQVRRSVLFDDVEIGRGASIIDSVVLPGAQIGAGSRLRGVIVDSGYRVPEGAVLERAATADEPLVLSSSTAHEEAGRYAVGR